MLNNETKNELSNYDELNFDDTLNITVNMKTSHQSLKLKTPQFSSSPLEMFDFSFIPQSDVVSYDSLSSLSRSSSSTLPSSSNSDSELDCNCSSSSEISNTNENVPKWNAEPKSKIMQVDGNEEEQNQTRLAPFNCESEMLSAVINIFRSLSNLWNNSSDHQLCMKAKSKTGLRCLFCSFRSFSLRLNSSKTRHFLNPIEILSQIDQLPGEHLYQDNFPKYFSDIVTTVSTYERKLSNSLFGKDVNCSSCSRNTCINMENVIKLTAENIEKNKQNKLENLLQNWLFKKELEHRNK